MSRVDRHFHQLFSSPHLWKGIKICIPRVGTKYQKRKIDLSVLETIKLRGITELEICSVKHDFGTDMKIILQSLPQLERLSIDILTPPMFDALEWAASSGHLNLKKLGFKEVNKRDYNSRIGPDCYTRLLKKLPRLEEISLAHHSSATHAWVK